MTGTTIRNIIRHCKTRNQILQALESHNIQYYHKARTSRDEEREATRADYINIWIGENIHIFNVMYGFSVTDSQEKDLTFYRAEQDECTSKCKIITRIGKARWQNEFDTAEQAQNVFNAEYLEAEKQYNNFIAELNILFKKYNADIAHCIEGDTWGIDEDYQYITITINNNDYKFLYND